MVETQLSVSLPEGSWAKRVTTAHPDAVLQVLASISAESEAHALVEILAGAVDPVLATVRETEPATVGVLQRGDGWATALVDGVSPPILWAARAAGVPLLSPLVVQDGEASVEVHGDRERLSALLAELERRGCPTTVRALHEDDEFESVLTDRQWALLSRALALGYYETPRGCTLTELAERTGIAKSTCSELLRRAEGRVVEWFVEGHPRNPAPTRRYVESGASGNAHLEDGAGSEGGTARYRIGEEDDPDRILEVITHESARRLFRHADEPKTVAELAEECDLPTSTAYRMTEKLAEVGLFETVRDRTPGGNPPATYRRTVEEARVSLEDTVSIEGV